MSNPIISFQNFSFKYYFREKKALSNISFSIKKGDFILITGSSGSGKSTLCYAMVGLIPFFYTGETEGEVLINGEKIQETSVSHLSKKIGYIPQRVENTLITPYVLTEIAFPLEYRMIESNEIQNRINNIASRLSIEELLESDPQKLSEGQKQKIAIASNLVSNSEIIIADEPLANLDKKNKQIIFGLLKKLSLEGKTIIVSSHDTNFFENFASHTIRIENGQICDNDQELGRKERKREMKFIRKSKQEEILSVNKLNFEFQEGFELKDISFKLNKSDIVGIIGDNGSGKTTLGQLLCGILKPKNGSIIFDDKDFSDFSWTERIKAVTMVFQNPEIQFFEEKIKDEILLINENLKSNLKSEDIENLLKETKLDQYKEFNPQSLSHGEKRRLAFLAATHHKPSIIILDEITNGLDKENKKWLENKIINLSDEGSTFILISHDANWLQQLCNRLFQLKNGSLKETNIDVKFNTEIEEKQTQEMPIGRNTHNVFLSFLDKEILDPRSKMVLVFILLFTSLYAKNVYPLIAILIVSFAIFITSKIKLKHVVIAILSLSFFSSLATVIAFYTGIITNPVITFIHIEVIFLVSFFIIFWFFSTVNPYELAVGLEKMYVPAKLVWLLITIYQFIPVLSKETSEINTVRKMKGLVSGRFNLKKQYLIIKKTLYPLISGTINRGIDLAESMTLKGFVPKRRKNHVLNIQIKLIDILIIYLSCAFLGIVIYLTNYYPLPELLS